MSVAPSPADALRARLIEFARGASTEITVHDEALLPQLRELLGAEAGVYVAHTPRTTVDEVVRVAARVQRLGLAACPHIGARRLRSRVQLESVLRTLRDAGVVRILLIGGDVAAPGGEFSSALDVLDTGLTMRYGIESIGIAGYPEGHKLIATAQLWDALEGKQAFAERSGTRVHVVTQFGFDPAAVAAWAQALVERGLHLPVHAGIAGPVPLPRLIKYAVHCGIGASLNALMKNLSPFATVAAAGLGRIAATPDRMLLGLLRKRDEQELLNILKPHFFSLGGALETARWLRAVIGGDFELEADGAGFVTRDPARA
jgi:methylenetetrahydrofolate reductase (NADH)